MKSPYRFFILGAIAVLLPGCKSGTETQLNGGSGSGSNEPGYLYAGTLNNGVFRSTNNGLTWMPTDSGLTCDSVLAFAGDSTYLFAGTYGRGVFRSNNNGESWTQVNAKLSNHNIGSLLTSGSSLFAGVYSLGGSGGLFRSTDEGENWSQTEFPNSDARSMAALGQFLFAGSQNGEVFRSSDNGSSWTLMDNGLSGYPIFVLYAVGSTIFVGADNGLFRSNDSGLSWQSANLQGTIWAFIGIGNNLLAGRDYGKIVRSTDNGNNWTQTNISTGLSTGSTIERFALDGARIFVGTSANGVFTSTDNGTDWAPSNKGIESEYVWTLAIH
jgi:photosystem II stability/assembly factor-like uncharacterized protein